MSTPAEASMTAPAVAPAPARILVVEDNESLALGLALNLEIEGYQVETAGDGRTGLGMVRRSAPDLIILDLMLPALDGYGLLQALRAEGCETPVLILTARGEETAKLRGFRVGADDYVTKPFSVLEVLARVEALLRRCRRFRNENGTRSAPQRFGDLEIDRASHSVTLRGRPVALSPKEFALLEALVRRHGAVASRLDLLKEVWGFHCAVTTRTVDAHVKLLRRKLEDHPSRPRYILTVRKVGYRFQP